MAPDSQPTPGSTAADLAARAALLVDHPSEGRLILDLSRQLILDGDLAGLRNVARSYYSRTEDIDYLVDLHSLLVENKVYKCVVAGLMRGYPRVEAYDPQIVRNRSVEKMLRRFTPVDVVIFHEGNISESDQKHIRTFSGMPDIGFVDISEVWRAPTEFSLEAASAENPDDFKRFALNYRLMCTFNAFYIWNFVKDYDYVLRIDEDCILLRETDHVFAYAYIFEKEYLCSRYFKENHRLTNSTLPGFYESYLSQHDFVDSPRLKYNYQFPYTNFYLSKVAFWQRPDVKNWLDALEKELGVLKYRWGDLPIHGLTCQMFLSEEAVGLLPHAEYYTGAYGRRVGGS